MSLVVNPDFEVSHELVNGRQLLLTMTAFIHTSSLDEVAPDVAQIDPARYGASSAATEVIGESR